MTGDSPSPRPVPGYPETGWAEVDGARQRLARLRHRGAWQPGKPVLVLLHEGLGCIELWRDFPARLAARTGLDALVCDRLGYGGSDPDPLPRRADYLHREALVRLPAVLEQEGITSPLLVGHSDGGSIALVHAARHGVHACLTMAAHVFVEEITLAGIRDAVRAWEETDLASRLARYHGPNTDWAYHSWVDTWLAPWFRGWNVEEELAGIRDPVLALQGENDEYGSPDQVASIVRHSGGPAQSCLLPRCGHSPHREQPDATLTAIEAFLGRRDSR